jgi:hypothetical protein
MNFGWKLLILPVLLWTENKMLEVLSNCEPEILQVGPEQCHGVDADYQTISILSDLYDRELVGIITWAKQIPGAKQTLLPNYVFHANCRICKRRNASNLYFTRHSWKCKLLTLLSVTRLHGSIPQRPNEAAAEYVGGDFDPDARIPLPATNFQQRRQ